MKSIQKLLGIFLIFIICSCSKDDIVNPLDSQNVYQDSSEINIRTNQSGPYNIPIYSQNEIIVQYIPEVHDTIKESMRSFYEVLYYEVCQLCPEGTIEKWTFDLNIQIEPKKQSIEADPKVMAAEHEFELITEVDGIEVGTWEDTSYEPLIAEGNPGITIAIIDTGFDPFFPFWYEDGEPIPMLYDASDTAVEGELSGWDFVNEDPNPFDDNLGKHGSILSFEFQNILSKADVPFQILPLKAFGPDGKASYFHILCSTFHALPRADIIQMSFGWYLDDGEGEYANTILENLIELYSEVIVVASAGNNGESNDTYTHFPSNFNLDNIIAVAATDAFGTYPALWSNFGILNVDFWAAGMNVPFYDYDGLPIPEGVEGTSFAAPQVAALAAIIKDGGGDLTVGEVIDLIIENGILAPDSYDGMVKYDRYFPMMVE